MAEMGLVDTTDWSSSKILSRDQRSMMFLLDVDVRSVQIAYHHFNRLRVSLSSELALPGERDLELFHHAQVYVCAVRRVSRLLEALYRSRGSLDEATAEVIYKVWRSRRAMLESYRDARDAIEHIDSEIRAGNKWSLMNLDHKRLMVTKTTGAEISGSNLQSVVDGRNQIVDAILAARRAGP